MSELLFFLEILLCKVHLMYVGEVVLCYPVLYNLLYQGSIPKNICRTHTKPGTNVHMLHYITKVKLYA